MSAPVPLSVFPWPIPPERLELLKAAKATLTDITTKVIPIEAAPGTHARVLSFAGRPPFACTWAPIRPENVNNVESIAAALRFVLTAPENAPQFSHAAWFSDVLGVPVYEIDELDADDLEIEREMAVWRG